MTSSYSYEALVQEQEWVISKTQAAAHTDNDLDPYYLQAFAYAYFFFSVFTSIKRRHFEQVQVAVPIILNVLKAVALDSDDADDAELESVFHRAVGIANSLYEVCNKLVC